MKGKSLNIKVEIGGYPYRVKIEGEDEEEIVRAAAKNINIRMEVLKKQFSADPIRYIAMAALQEGVERLRADANSERRIDVIAIENANNNIEECLRACNVVMSQVEKVEK